jgi:hypothetical protein
MGKTAMPHRMTAKEDYIEGWGGLSRKLGKLTVKKLAKRSCYRYNPSIDVKLLKPKPYLLSARSLLLPALLFR